MAADLCIYGSEWGFVSAHALRSCMECTALCGGHQRNEGGKGKSEIWREKGSRDRSTVVGDGDVVLRSRCTLKKLVAVNGRMTARQREAVEGTVLRPCLEYCDIDMERHLTLALIRCWVPRWKAFRIAGRRVPFSRFDVALMTGLPATGRRVELDGEEVSSEVGLLIRGRMAEWEEQVMGRRVPGRSGKKRRFFRNYVAAMASLCEDTSDDDRVGLWLQIYAFMILSGVLFPRTPYGAAWSLLHYVADINTMREYAWAEAVWRVLVETIEDTQKKLSEGPLSEVQLNGFCVLIQVIINIFVCINKHISCNVSSSGDGILCRCGFMNTFVDLLKKRTVGFPVL